PDKSQFVNPDGIPSCRFQITDPRQRFARSELQQCRVQGTPGGLELRHKTATTIRATAKAHKRSHANRSLLFPAAGNGVAAPLPAPVSTIQLSSLDTSAAFCQRASGSFARHFLTTCSSAGGVKGCETAIGCASEERMAAIKLARLFPANAGLPVAIS